MIRYTFILALLITLFSCGSTEKLAKTESASEDIDSVEYLLIVYEPGFDSWMATRNKPVWYYSLNYYKNWNKIYVTEFNYRVRKGSDYPFIEYINYDFTIDYGIDLDFRLYWYFMFIQEKYNISLYATRF